MEELVKALEKEDCNVELYLNQISDLNDEEIITLFESKNIKEKVKDNILCYASERIKHLSTKGFIKVSNWASNVEEYKKNYFSKIEEMTYEEFVDLIYNGIYEPSILLELVKTDIYKRYLQQEKKEQKENNLQCLNIQMRLDSSINIEEGLNKIGTEIMSLEMWNILQNNSINNENLKYLIDNYLNTIIENINDIDLENKSIKICFSIINLQLKYHEALTNKMIEFYSHVRLKELNLKNACKNVIVTLGKSNRFGTYTAKDEVLGMGVLKIYSEYLPKKLREYNPKCSSKLINLNINLKSLRLLSHEFAHILI